MDSTTHTTTTVEFVDWRAKAKAKLEAEDKLFKGSRAAKSVQSYVPVSYTHLTLPTT